MHPMTRAAAQEAAALEFRQFQCPEDRERLAAVRALALEQVAEDRPSMSGGRRRRAGLDRVGRQYVVHVELDDGVELWRRWTPDQMALEDSIAPLLQDLSPQQREAIHLLYWGRLTERQAAVVMKVTRPAVQHLRNRALAALHRAITARYFPQEAAA